MTKRERLKVAVKAVKHKSIWCRVCSFFVTSVEYCCTTRLGHLILGAVPNVAGRF
jgi:hypothetical protein